MMKKLLFLTLIAAFVLGMQNQSSAGVNEQPVNEISEAAANNNYAFFRLDQLGKLAYLVFYGPLHKLGDNVNIKVHNASSGAIVQQEMITVHGGSMKHIIYLDGLEPGAYSVVVTGNIYNLNQPFILE